MSRTKVKAKGHNKTTKNRAKLSKRVMDPDQVCEMLTPEKMKQIEERKADPFLPGEGKFYCVICDKHFINENAYKQHEKGGQHRIRLREVRDGGFNPKAAMAAVGLRVDNGKKVGQRV